MSDPPPLPAARVDAGRWRRIDEILAAALERPAEERHAWLAAACGDDDELRREVESLLARDREDSFLEAPVPAAAVREALARAAAEATADYPVRDLAPGRVLGNRLRIRGDLGRGGMGEVWRALDLKLRVDVALKAVHPELLASPRAVEALRQEVRAARAVVSPNVCRVFDLVEMDGHELVSMEYVDGTTLADVLAERSPLPLDEAREIAAQLLAGLEAIHAAGLVHRDVKPENVMLTRAGRVVVMDFGIAKASSVGRTLLVSGTPAYMAPEQSRGDAVDARADVFSAGIVLAEMVAPGGARDAAAREAIREGLRRSPPEPGETPWAPVLARAVAADRSDRPPGASALARALEEVRLRTAGRDDAQPYPGLASFSAEEAEYFFGRELEIEEMWRNLRRPHLQALIGPSGAGKSSFLRAGLVATAPPGWCVVLTAPGDRPFTALARALAPELAADAEAVAQLVDFERLDVAVEVVGRWRRRHEQALLVLDQFEELFTQSPPEVQERFAELLARLALDADVHVLLALRDDFLFHCHRLPALGPVFSELTPLGAPTGDAMRRALVQPALKCGYRFEDEGLVDAMLAEVAGERGALPLVAFAMARLWDRRDRERGLLTRDAYAQVGGVAGALAQHAEAALERIGRERLPIVRELFRHLVTAQGTRATMDRDELLSVFGPDEADGPPRRREAAAVLDALIDARLLTSYELPASDETDGGRQRVELIHESLLASWPRLVRWQAQDQEGALLRDQLRQAARLWEERGRPDDLLWSGTSLREYQLWRERYPRGLSSGEERFTRAMTARALRRRRRRRAAVGAVVAAAVAVAAGMSVLWLRSEGARRQAVAAAHRAAAEQLSTLAQLELEPNPTAALAYALASLERVDGPQARRLALRALWRGPTAFELHREERASGPDRLAFSPDGRWLLAARTEAFAGSGSVRLFEAGGGEPLDLQPLIGVTRNRWLDFSRDGRLLVVTDPGAVTAYSLPGLRRDLRLPGRFLAGIVAGPSVITLSPAEPWPDGRMRQVLRRWRLPGGEAVSSRPWDPAGKRVPRVDPAGERILYAVGAEVYEEPLGLAGAAPRLVLRSDRPLAALLVSPDGERVHTLDDRGVGHVWSRATGALLPGPRMDVPHNMGAAASVVSPDGRSLARANGNDERLYLWDLEGPVDGEPLVLRRGARILNVAFAPGGDWLATQDDRTVSLWPLARRYPQVLRGPGNAFTDLVVDPRGEWIAASVGPPYTEVWRWPLTAAPGRPRDVLPTGGAPWLLAVSPHRDLLAAGTNEGLWLVRLDGRPPERLPGFSGMVRAVAIDPPGRRLAAGGGLRGEPGEAVVRLWDLETRAVQDLDAGDGLGILWVEFLPDGRLLSAGHGGTRLWDPEGRTSRLVLEDAGFARPSPDGRYLLALHDKPRPGGVVGRAFVHDLASGRQWDLTAHGDEVTFAAWDRSGRRVMTGSRDGTLRIGPRSGAEPHLLIGHEGTIWRVEMEPRGRWIASASEDGTVRLWPIPQGRPLHALPREQLLARLRALTNYRAVEDAASPSGYRLQAEPFAGWRGEPPRW